MFVSLRCDAVPPTTHSQCEEHWRGQQDFESVALFDRSLMYNHPTPRSTSSSSSFMSYSLDAVRHHQINIGDQSVVEFRGWHQPTTSSLSPPVYTAVAPWNASNYSTYLDNGRRLTADDCRRVAIDVFCDDITRPSSCCINDELTRRHHSTTSTSASQTAESCCRYSTDVVRPAWPSSISDSRQQTAVDGEVHCHMLSSYDEAVSSSSSHQRHRPVTPVQPCRTKDALVPLIIRAILSASDVRLSLSDICRYIERHSRDYATCDQATRWQNNVRHTLSHYEFFVKSGRVPTGRGNYWTIHPVCRDAFAADDFRIKPARHAVQMYEKRVNSTWAERKLPR